MMKGNSYAVHRLQNIFEGELVMKKEKRPFYKKWWVWFVVAIVLFIIIGSANSSSEVESDTEVDITLNPNIENETLFIEGETNLPDDTLIVYEITHQDNIDYFYSSVTDNTNAVVENGKYETKYDISDWPSGKIRVYASFTTVLGTDEKQPQKIIDTFGEMGEKMEGENVSEQEERKVIELDKMVEKP